VVVVAVDGELFSTVAMVVAVAAVRVDTAAVVVIVVVAVSETVVADVGDIINLFKSEHKHRPTN